MTQLAAAFIEVQIAISWVVDNYNRVAEWYASARRVMDIVDACDAIDAEIAEARRRRRGPRRRRAPACASPISRLPTAAAGPLLVGRRPRGRAPARPCTSRRIQHRQVDAGARAGGPVAGARAAASTLPDRAQVMITPQKSYLPLGSLKGALLYPEPDAAGAQRRRSRRRSEGRPRGAGARGSTRWRAGTRCCPTASASAWPSPGCSFTSRRSSSSTTRCPRWRRSAQAALLARLETELARRHHRQPRPAPGPDGRPRSPARAGAQRRRRGAAAERARRRWRRAK